MCERLLFERGAVLAWGSAQVYGCLGASDRGNDESRGGGVLVAPFFVLFDVFSQVDFGLGQDKVSLEFLQSVWRADNVGAGEEGIRTDPPRIRVFHRVPASYRAERPEQALLEA